MIPVVRGDSSILEHDAAVRGVEELLARVRRDENAPAFRGEGTQTLAEPSSAVEHAIAIPGRRRTRNRPTLLAFIPS